jgi:trafficking protein particle complex subunit 9
VQILETPLGNEYLNATLLPTLPPEGTSSLLDNGSKRDSLPPLPHNSSQPELNVMPAAISLKRNLSSGPGLRQASLNVSAIKRRHAGIGAASPHGRLFKVLGDFFLLAGKTEDAVIWYLERHTTANLLV